MKSRQGTAENQSTETCPHNVCDMSVEIQFEHKGRPFCSMSELDAEIGVLRMGLKDIEKELSYFQKKAVVNDGRKDKFTTVMSDFVTVAAYNFSDLEDQVVEMKQKVGFTQMINDINHKKFMIIFCFKYGGVLLLKYRCTRKVIDTKRIVCCAIDPFLWHPNNYCMNPLNCNWINNDHWIMICVFLFQYEKVCKSYGEDPKIQPDEFFGIFDLFLTSFMEANLENDRLRRQKDEEEKRAKMEEKVSWARSLHQRHIIKGTLSLLNPVWFLR